MIEALTLDAAAEQANQQGILVSSVTPIEAVIPIEMLIPPSHKSYSTTAIVFRIIAVLIFVSAVVSEEISTLAFTIKRASFSRASYDREHFGQPPAVVKELEEIEDRLNTMQQTEKTSSPMLLRFCTISSVLSSLSGLHRLKP